MPVTIASFAGTNQQTRQVTDQDNQRMIPNETKQLLADIHREVAFRH